MVTVTQADITKLKVADAIVSAANGIGVAGAGVAGAICRAAGPTYAAEIRAAAKAAGWYREGNVYVTSAGDLRSNGVRAVIHAVTMDLPGNPSSYGGVESCLRGIYRVCHEMGLGSVAVPGLGTGIGQLDPHLVARATVAEALRHPTVTTFIVDLDPRFVEAAQRSLARLGTPRTPATKPHEARPEGGLPGTPE